MDLRELYQFMVEHGALHARVGDVELTLDPRALFRPLPEEEGAVPAASEDAMTDEDFLMMSSPYYEVIHAERLMAKQRREKEKAVADGVEGKQ